MGLGSFALWFAILFGALGLAPAGSATASLAFAAAAAMGVVAALLVARRRLEPALWSLAAMLVIGQAAAMSLAW